MIPNKEKGARELRSFKRHKGVRMKAVTPNNVWVLVNATPTVFKRF
jgi:hypothetical protein